MSDVLYAIVTHGKIKAFAQLGHTEGHNDRSSASRRDNVIPDSHPPITLIGEAGADLGDVAKDKLRSHNIDPTRLRKNAVIANEDIYSASPRYFGDRDVWRARNADDWRRDPWVTATIAFLKQAYGNNLISAVLHIDEKTPHIHAVTLPLVEKARAKRGRISNAQRALAPSQRQPRPTVTSVQLDCRSLRGQNKWQLEPLVTAYAEAVAHLGLQRGRLISQLTKEERDAWSEKASPSVQEAKRACEKEAAQVAARQLALSAQETIARLDDERLNDEAEALYRKRKEDRIVQKRVEAELKQRAEEAARRRDEAERIHDMATQLRLRELARKATLDAREAEAAERHSAIRAREAEISEREAQIAAQQADADARDEHLTQVQARLIVDDRKLRAERFDFERAKQEILNFFRKARTMLRAFFVVRGMMAEVDVLDGHVEATLGQQLSSVDPTALVVAQGFAAAERMTGAGR